MNIDSVKWYYTDGEIRTMYRDAVDRNAQIKIIAELEAKPKELIIEKLRSMGEAIDLSERKAPVKRIRKPWKIWTAEEDEVIRSAAARGLNAFDTAKLLPGRTATAVSQRRTKFGILLPVRYAGGGRVWTPKEDALLKREYEKGTSVDEIAEMLTDRTPSAVIARAKREGWRRR